MLTQSFDVAETPALSSLPDAARSLRYWHGLKNPPKPAALNCFSQACSEGLEQYSAFAPNYNKTLRTPHAVLGAEHGPTYRSVHACRYNAARILNASAGLCGSNDLQCD